LQEEQDRLLLDRLHEQQDRLHDNKDRQKEKHNQLHAGRAGSVVGGAGLEQDEQKGSCWSRIGCMVSMLD
jgi:hypothetical protein